MQANPLPKQNANGMLKQLPEDVRNAISAGEKIEAIRLLRAQTGLGLADAKAAVEAGRMPTELSGEQQDDGLPPSVNAALASGNKIKAIQLLRESTGLGLKEAKERIEAVPSDLSRKAARRAAGLAPGEVSRGGLSLGITALVAALLALLAWLLSDMRP